MKGLPDHQGVEVAACGLALTTAVVGGVVVDYPCGFATYRPGGGRAAAWSAVDVEGFISARLPLKAPL